MTRVQQAGERIEELLATLRAASGSAAAAAEELVRLLLGLYGDGLGHIMDALAAEGAPGEAVRDRLLDDPLVESLLLLHDLHPLDTDARIQRALDRVRPYLGSHAGGVEYLGTGPDGVARLRLEGSCHGCPSSTVTVRLAIEGAVQDAAPEVTEVAVEGMTDPPGPQLLQIGRRPPDAAASGPPGSLLAGAAGDPGWVSLPGIGPPDGRPVATMAGQVPIVVCSVRGTLYAYCDACAACGSSLAGGTLTGERLDCPGCGAGYDVRSAGRSLDEPGRHLDPPGQAEETCELCAAPIGPVHGHLADLEHSTLNCACRACYLLFTEPGAARGRYRAVPERYLCDPARPLTAAEWAGLDVPVGLAFFLYSSRRGQVCGFYPSPAGVTECTLDLAAWARLGQAHPLLSSTEDDVEAVLVNRTEAGVECFLVPVDVCYELAGRMRMLWQGFDGGAEARQSIAEFLDSVRSRARDLAPEP